MKYHTALSINLNTLPTPFGIIRPQAAPTSSLFSIRSKRRRTASGLKSTSPSRARINVFGAIFVSYLTESGDCGFYKYYWYFCVNTMSFFFSQIWNIFYCIYLNKIFCFDVLYLLLSIHHGFSNCFVVHVGLSNCFVTHLRFAMCFPAHPGFVNCFANHLDFAMCFPLVLLVPI